MSMTMQPVSSAPRPEKVPHVSFERSCGALSHVHASKARINARWQRRCYTEICGVVDDDDDDDDYT